MDRLPDWVLDLVAEVERFEDEHAKVSPGTECLSNALAAVPHDVRAEARGWLRAKRLETRE